MKKHFFLVIALFIIGLLLSGMSSAFEKDVPRITKEDVLKGMNKDDAIIIDVRTDRDWADSDQKIKGAIRQEPGEVKDWAGQYEKAKKIILYCN